MRGIFTGEHSPLKTRRAVWVTGLVLLLVIVAAAGAMLYRSQVSSSDRLLENFDSGAEIGSAMTSGLFEAAARPAAAQYREELNGRGAARNLKNLVQSGSNNYGVVVGPEGVVQSYGASERILNRTSPEAPHIAATLAGDTYALSRVISDPEGTRVEYARAFEGTDGPRTLVTDVDLTVLRTLLAEYLVEIPVPEGGSTLVVDSRGSMLGGAQPVDVGEPVPDPELLQAVQAIGGTSDESFTLADDRHLTSSLIEGSDWRVVLTAPADAFLPSDRWVPWLILASLALAGLIVLSLTSRAISRSLALHSANLDLESANRELEIKQVELEQAALHDPLTGLPNRALFLDRLKSAVARDRRSGSNYFVLFLDLDNFKRINDEAGHTVGDEILRGVGDRLNAETRETDTVCRLGGDEFIVLLDDVANDAEPYEVARRLHRALRAPMPAGDRRFKLSVSIGGAYGEPGMTAEEMLALADQAMYTAKHEHPGGTYFEREILERWERIS